MWLFALCLVTLSLAGHDYYDSKVGWDAPGKVGAVVDVNGDGLDDIIFLESKTIHVYCATLPSGYKPCSSREFKNEDQFIGIIPADFNQNSDLGFIILTQSEEAAEEFGLLHLDQLNGTVVWRSSRTTSVVPVVADVDFDGYLDLIGLSEGERFVWINKGQSNGFQDRKWSELGDYFDLETYSSIPKFDLNINNHVVAVSPQKDEVNGVLSWFKNRWNSLHNRVNRPSGGYKNQSAETLEEVYYKRHEMDVKYEDWQPRPLPLIEPAKLARIPGSRLADINGDCVADLVLVVQSPDFESRYELEIWITEYLYAAAAAADTVNIKWRMWKGQRILLPEGTQAIELEDFTNSGNTDLLVFACDADWHQCQKLQRVFLMKMFQPPQCSSTHLMPKSNGQSLCKKSLCSSSPFVFGGVDEGMRRIGVSISNILHNTSETVLIPNIHPAFPTIIRTVDFDRDGYLDIVLLAENQPQSRFFRVLRNLPPRGDAEANDFTPFEFTMTSLKEVLTRLLNYARQFGTNRPRRFDPLKARRFEPVADIRTDSAPFYAGGFTEDWSDPGILNFIGFSGQSNLNNSSVHIFKKYSSSKSTFFLTALALGPVDVSCSNTSVLPMLGSTFVLTTTGLDGYKYPIKRVRGTLGGVQGVIKPKSTYIGLGSSSNYIDAFVLGVPYASEAAPSCAVNNETSEANETSEPKSALFHRLMEHFEEKQYPRNLGEQENPLNAYWRKWVAILPNSQISIKLGNPRWKNKEWLLSLLVNPGKQAFGIVVVRPCRNIVSFKGTAICLTIVGSVILFLDQKEKVRLRVGKFESLNSGCIIQRATRVPQTIYHCVVIDRLSRDAP